MSTNENLLAQAEKYVDRFGLTVASDLVDRLAAALRDAEAENTRLLRRADHEVATLSLTNTRLLNDVTDLSNENARISDLNDVLQAKLDAVTALHCPEVRYTPYVGYEGSFDTAQEAAEYADSVDPVLALEEVTSFTICAECGRVEGEQLREYGDEWRYREALWPCKTAAILNGEEPNNE